MEDIFLYIEESPLLFTQVFFWMLFAFVLLVYQFVRNRLTLRNTFLLVFSLYFYYLSSGFYFFLLIFSTFVDYFLGEAIYKSNKDKHRKWYVAISVFVNLSVLAYFKYTFFFLGEVNHWFGLSIPVIDYLAAFGNLFHPHEGFDTSSIFLPIGISFYTFQTISYSVDLYRRELKPVKNILDFAFYVSFFPQLVAGPIVRAAEFIPQIYEKYRLSRLEYQEALYLILVGLSKKIFISDYLSVNYVDRVFAEPVKYSGFENLMAVYAYAAQIYCDFSGYTDVAIGVALLLGFRLPLNFNSPYQSLDITDFWRRWHISLSSWLRDYLYIPLGGNRHGVGRTYLHLIITMLLGGLWHGAAWRFVIWGALHGGALALHKLWARYVPISDKTKSTWAYRIIMGLITFHFVCFCWIYFRAPDVATVNLMLSQMIFDFKWTYIPEIWAGYSTVFWVIILAYVTHLLPKAWKMQIQQTFGTLPDISKAIIITFILLILYQMRSAEVQPFIYFQF
ncbi:MAG: MBOAT family protein [Bernardetiaceae bacterium]|nr:MBOAT family protein [Bernardetiaceae bacterium]